MENAKIRPLVTPGHTLIFTKIDRRDYVLDGTRHAKFCSDRFKGFCSQNRRFAEPLGWLVFCSFFWVLQ